MRTAKCPTCGMRSLRRLYLPSGGYVLATRWNDQPHNCVPRQTETPSYIGSDDRAPNDIDRITPFTETVETEMVTEPFTTQRDEMPVTTEPVAPSLSYLAAEWVAKVQRIRKLAMGQKMRVVISPRASINGAKLIRAGYPEHFVAESVLFKGMDKDQRAMLSSVTFDKGRMPKVSGLPEGSHETLGALVGILRLGIHVMLVGPAGSGKTYAARQAAEVIGRNFYDRPMGPTVTEIDLLGFVTASGAFAPGFFHEPYGKGGVALLDEMDASHPAGLLAVNMLASNGHASFPNGETLKRHDDFVIVASANTFGHGADRQYVGRAELDAATLDRFAVLNWDYDETAEKEWAL